MNCATKKRIALSACNFYLALGCLLSPHPVIADDLTTLRVTQAPEAVYGHSKLGQPYLTSVSVEVRNAGKVPATGVRVLATLPTGEKVYLEGPDEISPNQKRVYTKSLRVHNPPKTPVKAEVTCSNCRF